MRKALAVSTVVCLTCLFTSGSSGRAEAAYGASQYQGQYQGQYENDAYQPYAPEQLDNLLAPIALYPDPLLAQVLVASTFPDQIQDAAGWVRRYGTNVYGIDDQSWDVSVKAVAHYPTILFMMNDQLDWTTALGQAYVNQSADAMASVQHLRQLARSEGNLVSTPQQQVIDDRGYIEIVPAEPQYIFVPTYDPGVIYSRRVYSGGGFGGYFSFGSGLAIGAWLNYDLDWGSRRVVYDGWHNGGWRERSRPFVHESNVYVNNRYQNVVVNRTVVNRPVNYENVDRFNSVHRDVKFDNHARANARPNAPANSGPGDRPASGANRNDRIVPQPAQPPRPTEGFNRGRAQDQPNPQQPSRVPPQNDNRQYDNNRGGFNQGRQNQPPAAPQPPQQGFNRGGAQDQPAPRHDQPALQQSPRVPPQSDNRQFDNNRGGFNQGRQNQPPAAPQPPQQGFNRGRVENQPAPQHDQPAPQQPSRVPPQNDNRQYDGNRGGFNQGRQNQPPAAPPPPRPQPPPQSPARAEQPAVRPAPPAQAQQPQRGNQAQGHADHSNDDRNKDRHDH